jgi:hypothetical protein
VATRTTRDEKTAVLLKVVAQSDWKPEGAVYELSYDPPFAIPFLRRNEVAVTVTR